MAKSIHERVRAQLEKKARDEKRAADRKNDAAFNRELKLDTEHELGVAAYQEDGYLPRDTSKAMREGFMAAARSEFEADEVADIAMWDVAP